MFRTAFRTTKTLRSLPSVALSFLVAIYSIILFIFIFYYKSKLYLTKGTLHYKNEFILSLKFTINLNDRIFCCLRSTNSCFLLPEINKSSRKTAFIYFAAFIASCNFSFAFACAAFFCAFFCRDL